MKCIIAASVTTLLLCSGSAAYAQYTPAQQNRATGAATTAQQPAAATASNTAAAPADPRLDVDKLTPKQREYLLVAVMSQNPVAVPEQIAKLKEQYNLMPEAQQIQMVKQFAQGIASFPTDRKEKILSNMPRAR